MTDKLIVHFEPLPTYEAPVDYLSYCLSCNTYHIHNQKPCIKCGKKENSVSLDKIAMKTVRRQLANRLGIVLIIYAVLFLLSRSIMELILSSVFTVSCILLHVLIYANCKKFLCIRELEKHLLANSGKIKKDLLMQFEQSKDKVMKNEYIEPYDELRYLSKLLDHPEIRIYKLICLSHFRLRADLPLEEMKALLLEDCNMILIRYIGEVAKIKKELIDEATISYILKYENQVLTEEKGAQIIASVLGTSLRSKYLFRKYAPAVVTYVKHFPKERLLRLCKIQDAIDDTTLRTQLLEQVKAIVMNDEAFKDYF